MPSETPGITDFKEYVTLGMKEGRPYIFINRLIFRDDIKNMALNWMSSDWTEDDRPEFYAVVGLPNRGHSLAPLLANYLRENVRCILMEKGTKLDPKEYATATYFKPSQNGDRTASGRVSRRHLQVERALVEDLKEDHKPIAARKSSAIYAEIPLKNGELAVSDRHAEMLRDVQRPRVLLVDGFLEDGKKALAAAELLDELGLKTIGLTCAVELINWRDETYHGREALGNRGIAFKSLVVYENGEFRNVASSRKPETVITGEENEQDTVQ